MMPWESIATAGGDPELAQLLPGPPQDVSPCSVCVVPISRALCLSKAAHLTHGAPESQSLGWAPAPHFPQCVVLQSPLRACWLPSEPLTKACHSTTLFPTKAGQVEEKEEGGHCTLVSPCE